MSLNWIQSLLYGLLTGLTDILPVSARAHQMLLLKLCGIRNGTELTNLVIHIGIFFSLYLSCQKDIVRLSRAKALARIPKRKRRRPLDERSLMDISMLKTMLVPALIGLLLYRQARRLDESLLLTALFWMLNGLALYIPQFLPGSNRDARTLSRVEGLLMGLGGGLSVIPGFSAVGLTMSAGAVCGVDRSYALSMTLLMNLCMTLGLIVHDLVDIFSAGMGKLSLMILLRYLLTGAAAFTANLLGIRLMRRWAAEHGNTLFAFYCIGVALFIFILNLLA